MRSPYTPSQSGADHTCSPPPAGTPTVTRAGGNVTLACPAARDTYVLLLEWRCRGCELPSDPVAPHEVSLVEYRSESVTLFHHDSRMSLNPTNYSLSFRPVLASDSGTYVCRVNNRDDSELPIKLIVQGKGDWRLDDGYTLAGFVVFVGLFRLIVCEGVTFGCLFVCGVYVFVCVSVCFLAV
ncbi:uncharacterized protein LOC119599252 [Penaeus monodon]|uniref:uncharacterized protein LOC119599252 n=1 Tax=Penaeus monodon TaxID=6687 RepID=UPI0018A7275D|nr:uncharacterized protein LOC119599252 [Penaeus monodon]